MSRPKQRRLAAHLAACLALTSVMNLIWPSVRHTQDASAVAAAGQVFASAAAPSAGGRAQYLSGSPLPRGHLDPGKLPPAGEASPAVSGWPTARSGEGRKVVATAENLAKRVNVKLAAGVDVARIAALVGATVVKELPSGFAVFAYPNGDIARRIAALRSLPGVISAEPVRLVTVAGTTAAGMNLPGPVSVTDPKYPQQWALAKAEVPQAWNLGADGRGVTIAVVDTGVDLAHPDLAANLVPGYDAIGDSTDPAAIQDDNGHGTHVAGIAAASLNGIGIVGVAYGAKIMPIKAMDSQGEGADADLAAGIEWAADHGAKIINLSLGSDQQSGILQAAIQYAVGKGCLIVAAAGNHEPGGSGALVYPANDPGVLAVTASDQSDRLAYFSDSGPQVALAAPGVDILSDYWDQGSAYAYLDGTSMASPFVAGVAALVWSRHPDWNANQVKVALETGAHNVSGSRDDAFGFGRVDAYRALQAGEPAAQMTAPASVSEAAASVRTEDASWQLDIPALAFAAAQTVTMTAVQSMVQPGADLPPLVTPAGTPVDVEWSEPALQPRRLLTLTAHLSLPASAAGQEGYIFRWSGSRWLVVGGGSKDGEIQAGIVEPGIYRIGFLPEMPGNRLAGDDRLATAIQIAETGFPTGADTVVLARADDFPDALAGVPLAYKLHAPILLTYPESLDPRVLGEIRKLAPKTILILGGSGAISDSIATELQSLAEVKRLAGTNRYATAQAIAQALGTSGAAYIANGDNFPDALSIAPIAAEQGVPILLTQAGSLVPETDQALRQLLVAQTWTIGGVGVVSPSVQAILPNPERLAGSDRYGTAAAVLAKFSTKADQVYVATGEQFPDALAGGVLAATQNTVIILIPPTGVTSSEKVVIRTWPPRKAYALGGPGVVPEAALASL